MSRRHFLRGAGIVLSLPYLEAMLPPFARAQTSSSPLAPGAKPRRMFGICNNLGLLGDQFFPNGTGREYKASRYLELLQDHRSVRNRKRLPPYTLAQICDWAASYRSRTGRWPSAHSGDIPGA